jgi:hypothetical protein
LDHKGRSGLIGWGQAENDEMAQRCGNFRSQTAEILGSIRPLVIRANVDTELGRLDAAQDPAADCELAGRI